MEMWLITTIILTIGLCVLGIIVATLKKRLSRLTQGHALDTNLEVIIMENNQLLKELGEDIQAHTQDIKELRQDAQNNIQKVGVVRFNSLKEMGGNQSFALAFTNKKNNGVVLSSLYAREQMRVFAKPIVQGASEYPLTNEEQQALKQSQEL